ncbi:hypothetical protein CBR_g12475 [Chara braunii]|uniref:Uncharacterized protein n=1 Tax=Chara braunii TaxID=69332 RepID=A0A388JSK6_CHABU|nr:hypothetical protein CBR_g12475 [Chara braunii]|eukprot:GBG60737.1 hypothetical protein CBR_g12475 [Chara braunii]
MDMDGSNEMRLGAVEWFSTAQVRAAALSRMVAMLRMIVTERRVPSMSWIRSVQQSMLEIARGLEEGPPPHPEAPTDRPQFQALMRRCCEELEEGQGLCG